MAGWKQRASRLFWNCVPEKTRIRHRLRRLNRLYDAEIKEARRQGDVEKEQGLLSQLSFEQDGYYGRLYELETNYWRRQARPFHVPLPERGSEEDSYWKCIEDREDGHKYWYLSEAGIYKVRSLIREEEKYIRDRRLAFWGVTAQIMAAFTGIGGVMIGILSAVRK